MRLLRPSGFARSVRPWLLGMLILGWASAAPAQVVRQLTDVLTSISGPGALDDAGTWVFAGSSADPLGSNPGHSVQLLRFDSATGIPTQLTTASDGVSVLVSVSDDGQWLAFASPSDLTGQNHDQSLELFVMQADGTGLEQLTNDPAVNAGTVSSAAISGSANRVVFLANTDPLGTNPDHRGQLFAIDRDGTNLVQLTGFVSGSIGGFGVSDDGTRVAFSHDGDPLGGNADLGSEIFAVNADGTGLRQLTSTPATFDSGSPALSGNGQTIAFQSDADLTGENALNQLEIFAIDWDGTGLAQVTSTIAVFGFAGDPAAQSPSITDDGQRVFFHSNYNSIFINFDGNFEIFSIGIDGSGLDQVTATFFEAGSLLPVVSGDGSRVAYYGVDTVIRLQVEDGTGGNLRELLTFDTTLNAQPEPSPDGSRVVFVRSTGLFGGDQVWRVDTDGGAAVQVTSLASGGASGPSIAGDNDTIVFSADSNPNAPANDDGSGEIFRIGSDGTGIAQLTSGASDTASDNPVIASAGNMVAFDSDADLLGTNLDESREIYTVLPDGTGVRQLTFGPAGTSSRRPRIDGTGTWVVFESNADLDGGNPDGTFEVYRARTDGSALERLTGDPLLSSRAPDLSSGGDRIVFSSEADPLGSNPELNGEIFAYDTGTASLVQLTATSEGASAGATISGDGDWVYFSSNAPLFEQDPDKPSDLYRVPTAGGPIERIGALRSGVPDTISLLGIGSGGAVASDDGADRAVFTGIGDFTGQNADFLPEIWVIDRLAQPEIFVTKDSPTIVSWPPESGPLRYDVVRGDVAALGFNPDDTVDLGGVACLEDDSPDTDTEGFGDALDPAPGQVLFFVYRGTQGLLDGPGTYGKATTGGERIAASGDCDP